MNVPAQSLDIFIQKRRVKASGAKAFLFVDEVIVE